MDRQDVTYTSIPLRGTEGGVSTTTTDPAERGRVSDFELDDALQDCMGGFSMEGLRMPENETHRCLCIIGIVVGILLILVLVLVVLSFGGLEYYELAFRRRRTTGSVDTSFTYKNGLHFIGPDNEFKVFQAGAHFEHFDRVSVFNADRLEVKITASLQYFIRPHQLKYLHKSFDLLYQPVLRKNAMDAIKGAATVFTNREMILQRPKISSALFKAVKERLGGRCCEKDCWTKKPKPRTQMCIPGCKPYDTCTEMDFGLFAEVRYFQLHGLVAPRGLIERYLKALTLGDEDQREQLRQRSTLIRKDTEKRVQRTLNEATEISQNATAWSGLIASRASAEAKAAVEEARSSGLKLLYNMLGITTKDQKNSFDYLRTLRRHGSTHMAVDYTTYVAGPMKTEL